MLMASLRKFGEVTRGLYIEAAWGNPLPEWTAELESELPEELQDWNLFDIINGELILKKGTFPS